METETAAPAIELGITMYEALAPVVLAIVTWLSARLTAGIRATVENRHAERILTRLNASVLDAVEAVHQQTVELIGRAREPGSPGGDKLTQSEVDKLRDAALAYVRSFWGPKGLAELAKVLGYDAMSSVGGPIDTALKAKIEATVAARKRATAALEYQNGNSRNQ